MAILDLLTPEIIAERFYTLPDVLQGALENKDNRRAIRLACVKNGVGDPDELQNAEAIIAATIFGLVHIDDLKETLSEDLFLDPETSSKISTDVIDKVLNPIRQDIEKVYAPIEETVPSIENVSAQSPVPASLPATPISETPSVVTKIPLSHEVPIPITTISEKKGQNKWQPTKLEISKAPAGTMPIPKNNTTPPAPAPFMMHQEESASPLATGADFKLNISKDMFKPAVSKTVNVPRPPKAAELEIGKMPTPPRPNINKPSYIAPKTQSRVIHYADLKTPVMPAPAPASAPAMPIKSEIKPAPVAKAMPTPPAPEVPIPPKPKPPKVVNFGPEEVK